MIVKKNLNSNAVLVENKKERTGIVTGKGIGFGLKNSENV